MKETIKTREEKTITITISEYMELIRKSERIDTVKRMCESGGGYISTDDVKAVLGIEEKAKVEPNGC